ncbi:unnamed protein product [Mytilus edulis]|uniref:Uncharacterized protein n=1 Tax=Mytilus edulis TaxID=6550 RepID=A0A8S3STU8_MYTED|nr:unnamed protein product [Mytilus edulis]
MIVGIVVSIVVIILMTAVIIVFMYRRIPSGQLLSLNTTVKGEPSTSIMDSYTVNAAYEQLHKTDKDKSTHCQSYDQLHSVHVAETINKTNPRISREEENKYESIEETNEKYYNTVTAHAEYEQLDQAVIEKTTNLYDPLHFTNVGNSDTTNDRSHIFVLKAENRKYEPSETKNEMDTSAVPLKYEQLDITKTDTIEEHTYYETSEDKKECDTSTVSSKYEDLDITKTDKSVKTYEQLHLKHVVVTEPTVENSNNMISGEIHAQCKPLGDNVNKDTNTDYSYYEQLDSADTNESTNAYDQLHAVHVVDITKTNDHEICKN